VRMEKVKIGLLDGSRLESRSDDVAGDSANHNKIMPLGAPAVGMTSP
jgi:hypothetical protein